MGEHGVLGDGLFELASLGVALLADLDKASREDGDLPLRDVERILRGAVVLLLLAQAGLRSVDLVIHASVGFSKDF